MNMFVQGSYAFAFAFAHAHVPGFTGSHWQVNLCGFSEVHQVLGVKGLSCLSVVKVESFTHLLLSMNFPPALMM